MSNIHTINSLPHSSQEYGRNSHITYTGQESNVQVRHRWLDILFPYLSWKRVIAWLSLLQIVYFVFTLIAGSSHLQPSMAVLVKYGAANGKLIRAGEIWRLVTPLFLHVSLWHVLFNLLYQLRAAPTIEKERGPLLFTLLYFTSGIAGQLLSTSLSPCSISLGASTAGFGLVGFSLVELALIWESIRNKDQIIVNVIWFFIFSLMLATAPGLSIDWRGHLGGFIAGSAIALIFSKGEPRCRLLSQLKLQILGSVILIAVMLVPLFILFFAPLNQIDKQCF